MPTVEELEFFHYDINNPDVLNDLREKWIRNNRGNIDDLFFICRFLGEVKSQHGREWIVLDVFKENLQIRIREEAAYHKPGTFNDWLFTRVLIVSVGKTTDEAFGMRENRVCWMNVSDHEQFDQDHPFSKSNNVFVPGDWTKGLDALKMRAKEVKNEIDQRAAKLEAERLRALLLVGKRV